MLAVAVLGAALLTRRQALSARNQRENTRFAEGGVSRMAGIGQLGHAVRSLEGRAGTRIIMAESA